MLVVIKKTCRLDFVTKFLTKLSTYSLLMTTWSILVCILSCVYQDVERDDVILPILLTHEKDID